MNEQDILSEIQRSLGRVEGKLETFDDRFERLEGFGKRIGSLEGWRKWMTGVQAAVIGIFAWLVK